MDLREFYDEFVTRWYNGETSTALLWKSCSLLEEAVEFFETVLQQVRGCEDPHEKYNHTQGAVRFSVPALNKNNC